MVFHGECAWCTLPWPRYPWFVHCPAGESGQGDYEMSSDNGTMPLWTVLYEIFRETPHSVP